MLSTMVAKLLCDIPHVGKIVEILLHIINVEMGNVEPGRIHSTELGECVEKILCCFLCQMHSHFSNGFIECSIRIATSDVASTRLNGCPIHAKLLCTLLRSIHWIHVLDPIAAERNVSGVITSHESDLLVQSDFLGMNCTHFPSSVWTTTLLIRAIQFSNWTTPFLSCAWSNGWVQGEVDILSNARGQVCVQQ